MKDASAPSPLRALIVDDEQMIRYLLVTALTREGFACETADDGEEAWQKLVGADEPYRLLVTDLLMPVRHGHSLAVETLAMPERPVVVVLTGVMEPRIAKDLMARGIEDIVFKPTPFRPFAAKMRALVDRRRPACPSELEIAATVAALTLDPDCDLRNLARHVRQAPTLSAGVLKAANCSFADVGGPRITDVEWAVVRLGSQRVGELVGVPERGLR